MAKMKLVTPDIDDLADAIARRFAWLLLKGIELENDKTRDQCPNCGYVPFLDHCYDCGFVPYWDRRDPDLRWVNPNKWDHDGQVLPP